VVVNKEDEMSGSSKAAGKKHKIEKGRAVAAKNTFPERYQQEQEKKKAQKKG